MNSYCALANGLPADSPDPNKHYHDHLYGFPIEDDNTNSSAACCSKSTKPA